MSLVVAGVAAPALRRRLKLPPGVVLGSAAAAPIALAGAGPRRGRGRDAAMAALNMWAYLAAYEMPNDDPQRLAGRVRVRYPIVFDRMIGFGTVPTVRLQRAFARPGHIRPYERVLVWCHWMWFFVPHGTVAYMLARQRSRFGAAAARMYAVFDLGAVVYWAVPTAPPWWAAQRGELGAGAEVDANGDALPAEVRRMMIEYGEQFWGDSWGALYDVLGGNPLAAMPSLHFATSVMAAHLLSEVGPVHGALGWTYAGTLGLALVYLGEHYAVDLLAGLALTEAVRTQAPRLAPVAGRLSRLLQRLEALAAVA
jgi:membrane-associated phospholipid phosphatase